MLKKSTNKTLIPLVVFLVSCAIIAALSRYHATLGENVSYILGGIFIFAGLISLMTFLVLADGVCVNLSEVDTYIETQGSKVIINPLPKGYSFEHGVCTPSPDARARTILVFRYDSTFERGYLCDYKGFSYKLGQADLEYILKKTRIGDHNG
jgi:hypothetical protein